jgi:hypothetical protein
MKAAIIRYFSRGGCKEGATGAFVGTPSLHQQ